MPPNKFSEFTFGFAFTQEVTTMCWEALAGAPQMPSLFDEGHGRGFDVSLGLWGWTLFAQFKRGFRATRSTALQWAHYDNEYYRFGIYAEGRSTQHEDLIALETSCPFHWVAYVAPVFHTSEQLNVFFGTRQVVDNVRMIAPGAIGHFDEDDQHCVTYRTRHDAPVRHSEPRSIEAISVRSFRDRVTQRDWQEHDRDLERIGPLDRTRPVTLDEAYFDEISSRMRTIARMRQGSSVEAVLGSFESMTPFGKARVAGRLFFGSELIVLPAAGQALEAE